MATIPIEIILQDAETPVDPTPTPEETNIVVPDTGAGTVGSGSTFSSSSAASIILPAILLAVALATVCTLLIHKHRKCQDNDKFSKKEKLLTATSATIAVLSATVLVGNLIIPVTSAATSVEPGTADLEVSDKITITATREADSDEVVIATVKNTSYATANLEFGYKVTASMAEGTTTANLYLDGNTDSPYYIAPVSDGTLTDNTWGYTLSEETEEYLAIPLADDPDTLKQVKDTVEAEPVDVYYYVKIASDMPSGTYTGELDYNLVALDPTIADLTYMQDFANLSEEDKKSVMQSMTTDSTYTLRDKRDEQAYTIAKLKDNKVWMTKNLNVEGGTTIDSTLSDIAEGYILPTENGFLENNKLPQSSLSGFNDNNKAYVYNTNNDTNNCAEQGCYSYYSWTTATAGSGLGISSENDDAPYSICPKGWKLPNSRSTIVGNSDFYQLAVAYGMDPSNTYQSTSTFYQNAGPGTVPNFIFSGSVSRGSLGGLEGGSYWSSTSSGSMFAEYLYVDSSSIRSSDSYFRLDGYAIRCIAQ